MFPKKTIGILGGMGPSASAYFYNLLITRSQEKYNAEQDIDYPPVILYSMPLEEFNEQGIVDESSVKEQIIAGAQKHVMTGLQSHQDIQALNKVIESMIRKGAQGIIIGCTELPIVAQKIPEHDTTLIDATLVLADAALEQVGKGRSIKYIVK